MFTIVELAKSIGVHRNKVDNVVHSNNIQHTKRIGRIRLFNENKCSKIRQLIANQVIIHKSEDEKSEPPVTLCGQLLNVNQMAELFGLSRRTVHRLSKTTNFPKCIYIGGSKRWTQKTVEDWLDNREN